MNRVIGAFKALYNNIKNICNNDENNYVAITLYVEKENYTAQKIYISLGMKECNYIYNKYCLWIKIHLISNINNVINELGSDYYD